MNVVAVTSTTLAREEKRQLLETNRLKRNEAMIRFSRFVTDSQVFLTHTMSFSLLQSLSPLSCVANGLHESHTQRWKREQQPIQELLQFLEQNVERLETYRYNEEPNLSNAPRPCLDALKMLETKNQLNARLGCRIKDIVIHFGVITEQYEAIWDLRRRLRRDVSNLYNTSITSLFSQLNRVWNEESVEPMLNEIHLRTNQLNDSKLFLRQLREQLYKERKAFYQGCNLWFEEHFNCADKLLDLARPLLDTMPTNTPGVSSDRYASNDLLPPRHLAVYWRFQDAEHPLSSTYISDEQFYQLADSARRQFTFLRESLRVWHTSLCQWARVKQEHTSPVLPFFMNQFFAWLRLTFRWIAMILRGRVHHSTLSTSPFHWDNRGADRVLEQAVDRAQLQGGELSTSWVGSDVSHILQSDDSDSLVVRNWAQSMEPQYDRALQVAISDLQVTRQKHAAAIKILSGEEIPESFIHLESRIMDHIHELDMREIEEELRISQAKEERCRLNLFGLNILLRFLHSFDDTVREMWETKCAQESRVLDPWSKKLDDAINMCVENEIRARTYMQIHLQKLCLDFRNVINEGFKRIRDEENRMVQLCQQKISEHNKTIDIHFEKAHLSHRGITMILPEVSAEYELFENTIEESALLHEHHDLFDEVSRSIRTAQALFAGLKHFWYENVCGDTLDQLLSNIDECCHIDERRISMIGLEQEFLFSPLKKLDVWKLTNMDCIDGSMLGKLHELHNRSIAAGGYGDYRGSDDSRVESFSNLLQQGQATLHTLKQEHLRHKKSITSSSSSSTMLP